MKKQIQMITYLRYHYEFKNVDNKATQDLSAYTYI